MKDPKYAYIYRVSKADYFVRHGHKIVGIEYGRNHRVCYKFEKTPELLETLEKYKETMDFIEKIKKNK